jgi:glycosyltransferase involved in cell wall biosynthesis
MKVLFLTNNLRGADGWSRYSLDFITSLQGAGVEVLCLVNEESGHTCIKEVGLLRSPLEYLFNPVKSFLVARKINKIIKDYSPDIVHFLVEPYVTILPFLSFKKQKTFLTVHGTYSYIPALFGGFKLRLVKVFYDIIYKRVDSIIAVSNYTKKYLQTYFKSEKISIVNNGVSLGNYGVISTNQKNKHKNKILFIGAIKKRKGVVEAVRGLKKYYDNYSKDFIYEIVGSFKEGDNYYKEVLKTIKECDLVDNVFLRGKVAAGNDLEKCYLDADLFLMTPLNNGAEFEGFGLVYLEANAHGVPTIGSWGCGAEDAIIDGSTGYLVDPNRPDDIAHKIDTILNKSTIKPGDCIDWAKNNDINKKVGELLVVYKEILNGK